MSPLFGRKKQEPEPMNNVASWEIAQSTDDDEPLILWYDSQYEKFKDKKKFGYQVGIAVPLNTPVPGGLPEEDENRVLLDLESRLDTTLCNSGKTLFVFTLTSGVMKEFVFYTAEPENIKERVESVSEQIQSHKIQVIIQHDPKWDIYKSFLP